MALKVLNRLRAAFLRPYLPFPRSGRPVARLSSAAVPGRLRIQAAEAATGFAFEAVDPHDFPRRVLAREVLARTADGFPLLAPVPGIVDYEPADSRFLLKTEGAVRIGTGSSQAQPDEQSADAQTHSFQALQSEADPVARRDAWLASLQAGALPVLEQRGLSLAAGFRQLFDAVGQGSGAATEPRVVISLRDGTGGIGWPALFAERAAELEALLELLAGLHQGVSILPVDRGVSGPAYYGATLPEVVVRRVCASRPGSQSLDPQRTLIEQGILLIGPATLFALLDWLFRGQPFMDRLSTVLLPGAAASKSPLFRLINGYSLGQLFQEKVPAEFIQTNGSGHRACRIVQGSRFARAAQSPAAVLEQDLNIFAPTVFEIIRGAVPASRPAARPCTGCRACDQVCPVNAEPFALLAGQSARFRADRCLECGLCEAACESAIPLAGSIAAARGQAGFSSRRPALEADVAGTTADTPAGTDADDEATPS